MNIRKIVVASMVILMCAGSFGSNVIFVWCPSPSPQVVGYKILYTQGHVANWTPTIYDTNSPCSTNIISQGTNWIRTYTNSVDVGQVITATISNLVVGNTYYFTVVGYDGNGAETPFSNELQYQVPYPTNNPPSQPQNFNLSGVK